MATLNAGLTISSGAPVLSTSVGPAHPLTLALPSGASSLLLDLNNFMAKSDGRDKLCALVQYVCMFIAAGQATPGNAKKIQMSVATARKVFRVMRPLEVLVPLLTAKNMLALGNGPLPIELLKKARPICNAVYFGADHIVWASQAGILQDKALAERAGKWSIWGWLYASCCTVAIEGYEVWKLSAPSPRKEGESEADFSSRRVKEAAEAQSHLFTLTHACIQAGLALGLLQVTSMKPRTTGALGVIASFMNCWMLWPVKPAITAAAAAVKKTN